VAVTIFGGLISSTLLDTVLTPLLFLKLGERPLARLLTGHEASRSKGREARPAEAF
jgi:HME family heavy-metal exporter